MSCLKKILKWGGYCLICAFFVIACVEFAGKWLLPDLYDVLTSDIDHRMSPGEGADINSDGLRAPIESSELSADDYNILVLGDSFVYGSFLDSEQTIPARIQELLREKFEREDIYVINFGWVSSSPWLSYRLLEDIGDRYKPDAIILCFDMTDFHNDLFYRKLAKKEGVFATLHIAPVTSYLLWNILTSFDVMEGVVEWLYGVPAQLYFPALRPLGDSIDYFPPVKESILMIDAFAKQRNIPFSLIILPRNFQYSDRESPEDWQKDIRNMRTEPLGKFSLEPFRFFDGWAKEVSFPVVSLLSDFQDPGLFPTTFQGDLHFNENGARLAASFIVERCDVAGCFSGLLLPEGYFRQPEGNASP